MRRAAIFHPSESSESSEDKTNAELPHIERDLARPVVRIKRQPFGSVAKIR